jgi:hypothetical protein
VIIPPPAFGGDVVIPTAMPSAGRALPVRWIALMGMLVACSGAFVSSRMLKRDEDTQE